MLIFNIGLSNYNVYLLTWGSTQTYTGAGHSSMAFKDSNEIHYFSHYPKDVGLIDTVLTSMNDLLSLDSLKGIQRVRPQLVLEFDVLEKDFVKMLKVAKRNSNKKWTLFNLNCSDFVKRSFRKSKFDLGYAFLISTPYELIRDLRDHNIEAFQNGKVRTIKGVIHNYLNEQPRAIPYTLKRFFLGRK
jgi:hypothetical protein